MGYVVLVPGNGQVGDEVCVFSGGAVPFALREDGSGEMYRLVGEGYVHGFMYCEALSFKHIREQDFISFRWKDRGYQYTFNLTVK